MGAPRKGEAEAFISDPPQRIRVFLIYGDDAGQVTARARGLEATAAARGGASPVRIGSDELSANPGRISDEAFAQSLFGGDPVVSLRVLNNRHNALGAIAPVLERSPDSAWVIVEAGELKADNALRKAVEKCPHAAAIPCFEAGPDEIAALASTAAAEAQVRLEPDALDLLVELVGSDRLAVQNEVEKLILYARPGGTVHYTDVAALIGESAAAQADEVIDAALAGRADLLDAAFGRYLADGAAAALASLTLRRLLTLQRLRDKIEAGATLAAALEGARPPLFGARRQQAERILRQWPAEALRAARAAMADAVVLCRRQSAIESAAVSQALHRIAARASRRARSG